MQQIDVQYQSQEGQFMDVNLRAAMMSYPSITDDKSSALQGEMRPKYSDSISQCTAQRSKPIMMNYSMLNS